jgi:carbonic anhydrase/acetyltransferase-like protein (isoleucine patch superfamily)
MLHRYRDAIPQLGRDVFVAPTASVIGWVTLGDESSVWFGAVLRGDVGVIRVGARSNIQDQSVVHVTEGAQGTFIGDDVVIGHRALVHECRIEDCALIGMGSVLLDGAVVGRGAIVAAGAVVREGQVVPPFALVAGVPAEVRKVLLETSLEARRRHARHYVALARSYLRGEGAALDPRGP